MTESTISILTLAGGELCLDFVNTVEDYRSEHPYEHMNDYAALVAWGRHVEILDPELMQKLITSASRQPEEAARVHQRALALRSALYRLFTARRVNRGPRADDLVNLNELLGEALSQGRLRLTEDQYTWHWMGNADNLVQILYPVARSAAELLTSVHLASLGECENCGWLFIDTSRNHSRRWCSMEVCGNRVKARRHYQRSRKK
jgi:predicted RNA-binding Zn ribbon-like protein